MTFLETRGMLAKLLATENLIIEHDATADTASFDTATRTLKLPVLKTNSEHVYNLFVAHEVGHALQTPVDWKHQVPEDVPFDIVNVVEDVRVERFIQEKFPGLKRDFSNGYNYLSEQDFFALKGKNISDFNLIDRINLHFKLGSRALVRFSDEEMEYVKAVEDADTFQKVCLVSKLISDFIEAEQNKAKSLALGEVEQPGSGMNSSQNDEGDSDSDSDSDKNDADGNENEANINQPQPVESEEQPNTPSKQSHTQNAFDGNMSQMKDKGFKNDILYLTNPPVNFDNIVSVDELREDFKKTTEQGGATYFFVKQEYNKFVSSIKRDVAYMAQQFEMRKAADLHRRARISRTGVLDTNRLHNYKLTDDLFLRHTALPEGKNHWMVMLLDWSGSMDDICISTVKQIIVLALFCRKVSIPFTVYTFTNGNYYQDLELNCIAHRGVKLVNVINSSAKRSDLEQDMLNMFSQAWSVTHRYSSTPHSSQLMMSGTPLMNALFMMPDVINKFKRETNSQKMSFVCVTDGESHPLTYGKMRASGLSQAASNFERVIIRKGSQAFNIDKFYQTAGVVKWLRKECPDVNMSHIYLGGYIRFSAYVRQYETFLEVSNADFSKDNGCVIKSDSWPVIACISPKGFGDAQADIQVDVGAKKAEIRKALKRYLKSHTNSRVILGGLVESMA